MKMRISKAYRNQQHIGWKKTVGGRSWFLGYGTSPADEARAIALATPLEAKWQMSKLAGGSGLSQTDFEEARDLVENRPRWAAAQCPADLAAAQPALASPATGVALHLAADTGAMVMSQRPSSHAAFMEAIPVIVRPAGSSTGANGVEGNRRWLYATMDEVISHVSRTLKHDASNGDHVFNTIDRIGRARDAVQDMPLDSIRRKELDDWLLNILQLTSKNTGKRLSPATIRNIACGVPSVLTRAAEWEWWTPPPLWERAFKPYTIKKLQTPMERRRRRQRAPSHSIAEKRVLWHLALPFERAMMGLADWAGHTQNEISTVLLDEIVETGGEMYIIRDRYKTGVPGRWWIPPELAAAIRWVIARTPRDPKINPLGLAFLSPQNMPLVHRAEAGRRARSDYVGKSLWPSLLRAGAHYGVRHISFKYMRKGMAQLIRDKAGKEVSRTFLAQADEDVQDEHYTRPSTDRVEQAVRELYPELRLMFERIPTADWEGVKRQIQQENGVGDEDANAA